MASVTVPASQLPCERHAEGVVVEEFGIEPNGVGDGVGRGRGLRGGGCGGGWWGGRAGGGG